MNLQFTRGVRWKPYLIRLIILLAASLYLSIAAYIRFNKQKDLDHTQIQMQIQKSLNLKTKNALNSFKRYFPEFQNHKNTGRIGDANRLDWIETLNQLALDIGIPDIHFTLEKTKTASQGDTQFFHNEIPITITDMYLNMHLLHEGDLYKLLNQYAILAQGSYSIESCEIRRVNAMSDKPNLEGLQAKCQLRWYNLYDISKQWIEDKPNAT